jgi:hypothetical protein
MLQTLVTKVSFPIHDLECVHPRNHIQRSSRRHFLCPYTSTSTLRYVAQEAYETAAKAEVQARDGVPYMLHVTQ